MIDKQIIIDGVDVNDCHNKTFYKNDEGDVQCKCYRFEDADSDTLLFGICKQHPHCYYKQLKRKEQECEELKAKFQDMKKSRDIALKEYNEEFEYKRQITVEHLEQKKELLKQLDQLKTENEELKKQNNQFDNGINEQFSKIIELEGRNNFLKQILTEIKEIAEKIANYYDGDEYELMRKDAEQILQKISEVE